MSVLEKLTIMVDADTKRARSEMDNLGRSSDGLGKKVGNLGTALFKIGALGIAAVGSGLIAGAVAGFKFNSSVEQTTIAMGTMLGSADKAKTLIGDVTKMAASTPFEFPELADATKKLIAYGVGAGDAVPLMTRLGDVSAALGIPIGEMGDMYGKMKVSGRITMEDINQMAGRGIPIYKELGKVFGKSESEIRGMVESGKVGFPDVEKAFENMTNKGGMFAGMMEAQSKSFSGLWSTIKDGVAQAFGDALKPAFEWIVATGMPKLIEVMPRIASILKDVMGKVGGFVTDVVGKVQTVIAGFQSGGLSGALAAIFPPNAVTAIVTAVAAVSVAIAGLVTVFGFFAEHGELTKVLLVTLAAGFGAFGVVSAVIWLATAAVAAFGAVLAFVTSPIGIIVLAVAALAAAAYLVYTNWEPISAFFGNLWATVSGFFVDTLTTIATFLTETWTTIAVFLGDTWTSIWETMKGAWDKITTFFAEWWPLLLIVFTGGIAAIPLLIAENWEAIKTKTAEVWETIKGGLQTVWDAIASAFVAMWDGIKTAFDAAKDWVAGIPAKILAAIGSLASLLLETGKDVMRGLLSGIKALWDAEVSGWLNIGSKITSAVGSLGSLLYDAGRAIMQGLLNGITGMLGGVLSKVRSIGSSIKTAVTGALGIHSPSTVMAEVGKNIMLGLGQGMVKQSPGVLGIASGLAGSISGAMGGVVGPSIRPSGGGMGSAGSASTGSVSARSGGAEAINLTIDLGEGIMQRLRLERDSLAGDFRVKARTA